MIVTRGTAPWGEWVGPGFIDNETPEPPRLLETNHYDQHRRRRSDPRQKINEACPLQAECGTPLLRTVKGRARMLKSDVKYRFSIDMKTL